MSRAVFSRSPDLQRLRDDGYAVEIRNGFLILHDVPYLSAANQISYGKLVSALTLNGDQAGPPDTHVVMFEGDYPIGEDGRPIEAIRHQSVPTYIDEGLSTNHKFSCKPDEGYPSHYEKMSTYAAIISAPAHALDSERTPRVHRIIEDEEESVFHYVDNASSLAGIVNLSARLKPEVIGIIGTGGSGAYILDLVAKTPVKEIRVFDPDEFKQHNAFRSPGAPSIEELRDIPKKVDYLTGIYSRMHRNIVPYSVKITADNLHLLDGITFAFLSMDAGPEKAAVIGYLEQKGLFFIDVGMGLDVDNGSLAGILRVTTSTPEMRDHVHQGRVSFAGAEQDIYASNIQVADLNMLNAALAVHRWKKLRGFYRDLEREHHTTFTTDGNQLTNSDFL